MPGCAIALSSSTCRFPALILRAVPATRARFAQLILRGRCFCFFGPSRAKSRRFSVAEYSMMCYLFGTANFADVASHRRRQCVIHAPVAVFGRCDRVLITQRCSKKRAVMRSQQQRDTFR